MWEIIQLHKSRSKSIEHKDRFDSIWVSDDQVQSMTLEEAKKIMEEKVSEYIKNFVQKWKIQNKDITVDLWDNPSVTDILALTQRLAKAYDDNNWTKFEKILDQWTEGQKSALIADLTKQLGVDSAEDLKDSVDELMISAQEYAEVKDIRQIFRMVMINKLKKKIQQKRNPADAMKLLVQTAYTLWKYSWSHMRFKLSERLSTIWYSAKMTNEMHRKRIQEVMDILVSKYSPYRSLYPTFAHVADAYMVHIGLAPWFISSNWKIIYNNAETKRVVMTPRANSKYKVAA